MDKSKVFGNSFLYGADYNPEQWLHAPEVLAKDIEMMKEAHVNILSVGMFSWAKLEIEEGVFDFSWLDQVLDRFKENNIKAFLATPSGAKPQWLSIKYPEIRRVNELGQRELPGRRHNHCPSSPIYREKVKLLNEKLAQRYSHHEAVLGWHLSNEYGGYCYCPLCQARFRKWLEQKYGTIENLNQAYWSTFWSHTYHSFDEVQAPSPLGEDHVHALKLDWKRFSSDNALDFCKFERDTVRKFNPDLPITTNFMEFFRDYDYVQWAKELDFVCWDSYPEWHVYDDPDFTSSYTAMNHDWIRSLKSNQPWVLMESTPSCTNWRRFSTLKRPGMNILSSLQAVAHGADSVQFFQWRKSRGSSEKFHGAIVDHVGHLQTRVGREACQLGKQLSNLSEIVGSRVNAKVALIYDTQNRWIVEDSEGPRNEGMEYLQLCHEYYKPLFKHGVAVDVVDQTADFSKYQLVIGPMVHMIRGDFASRISDYVKQGGCYVSTFWSGVVDETDLCFLDGVPGPLKEVVGVWEEEIDSLKAEHKVPVKIEDNYKQFFNAESYQAGFLCGLSHVQDQVKVLASYDGEFYKGMPVLTEHNYGQGLAYYVAARMDQTFVDHLVDMLLDKLQIKGALGEAKLPYGVSAMQRDNEQNRYVFVGNYDQEPHEVDLGSTAFVNLGSNQELKGKITLDPYAVLVLKQTL